MKLLLVDSRVSDIATIKGSILPGVDVVVFDFFTETSDSLVSKIENKVYSSIGLFQENYDSPMYYFMKSVSCGIVQDVAKTDSALDSWSSIIELLTAIKDKTQFTTFDMMGCGIYASDDWKYIIRSLESKLSININSSIDYTGDDSLGGNWILEDGNVNLIGAYFSDAIKGYKYVLGGVTQSTYVIANVAVDANGKNPDYSNSKLYGVGSNTKSDLFYISGYANNFTKTNDPVLSGARAQKVIAMSRFIDQDGKLWVVGSNYYPISGTGDNFTRAIWTKIPNSLLDLDTGNLKIVDFIGYQGARSFFILLSDGSIWRSGAPGGEVSENSLNQGVLTKVFTKVYDPATYNGRKVVKFSTGYDLMFRFILEGGIFTDSLTRQQLLTGLPDPTVNPVVECTAGYNNFWAILFQNGTIAGPYFQGPRVSNVSTTDAYHYKYLPMPSGVTRFTFFIYSRFLLSVIDQTGSVWVVKYDDNNFGVNGFVKVYDATISGIKAIQIHTDYTQVNGDGTIANRDDCGFFVLREDGSLMAGGKNSQGRFGNSSFPVNSYYPTLQVVHTPTSNDDKITSASVSTQGQYILITKADGSVWGAGPNGDGVLGTYNSNSSDFLIDLGINAKQITTNGNSTAVITADNKLYTKGSNWFGQLGLGYRANYQVINDFTLAYTPDAGVTITYVSFGGSGIDGTLMMCLSDGRVLSCGSNYSGRAGYNYSNGYSTTFIPIYTPPAADPNDSESNVNFRAFNCSSGNSSSMFILNNGVVYICTDTNNGTGPTIAYQPDTNPANPGDKYPATFVCVGPETQGIVAADGSVWMRGYDMGVSRGYSSFGMGSLSDSTYSAYFPEAVSAVTVDTPNYATYINGTPTLKNRVGQLYQFYRTWEPENHVGLGAILIGCGTGYSVIITNAGSIYSTGNNDYGQLAVGDRVSRLAWTLAYEPTPDNPIPAKSVKTGEGSTTIVLSDKTVKSAGNNSSGHLGIGGSYGIYPTFTSMQNVTTLGDVTDAYALNDALAILITKPAFGPFNPITKLYNYTDTISGLKQFTVSPPSSTSQGVWSFTSSDSTIASIDSVTGLVTINNNNKLGTVTIRATQDIWRTFTDVAFKETTLTIAPIDPVLTIPTLIQKWFGSRTLGVTPFTFTAPTTLSAGAISYSISNTSVATINSTTGQIALIGVGSATITVSQVANSIYASSSKTSTLTVNALQNPNLSSFTVSDVPYGSVSFFVTAPTYASDDMGALTYSVLNTDNSPTDLATIDSVTGKITLNTLQKIGDVKVVASLEDSGIYAAATSSTTFEITPLDPELSDFIVPGVTYGDDPILIVHPSTLSSGAFTYTFLNVGNDQVNTSVLSLSQSGLSFAIIGAGTVRVRATQAANAQYSASSIDTTVTVAKAVPKYVAPWVIPRRPLNYFVKTGLVLYVNDPVKDPYTNAPVNSQISDGAFTYSSTATGVASVNSTTGELTLYSVGYTTINVTQAETSNFLQGTNSASFRVTNPAPIFGDFIISGVKRYGDAPFIVNAPTSTNTDRRFTFASSDPTILRIDRIDDTSATATILSTGSVTVGCTQEANDDYDESSVSYELDVLKIITTLGPFSVPSGKNYLSAQFSISAPSSSRVGTFTFASSDTNVATINATSGLVTIIGAGSATISCTNDATRFYYSASVSDTLTVAKVSSSITSTFSNLSVNYLSTPATLSSPSTSSTDANLFSYASSNLDAVEMTGNVVGFKNAGSATITCTLLESANFLSSSTTFNVTVTPINTTYPNGWTIPNITYAPNLLFTIIEPVSLNPGAITYTVSDSAVASVTQGNKLSIHKSGLITLTATETATQNYNTATISTAISILRADPNAGSFSVPIDKAFGDSDFSIGVPTKDSDGAWTFASSDLSVATIISNATIHIVKAGTTTISATLPQTDKYNGVVLTATLTIAKARPNVTFPSIVKTYLNADFAPSFTSQNTNSVTFSSNDVTIATIVSGLVHIVGAGTVQIRAQQLTDDNFSGVDTTCTLTINKANPTFGSYSVPTGKGYASDPFTLPALQSNSNGVVTYSSVAPNIVSINSSTRLATPQTIGITNVIIAQAESANFNFKSITVPLTIGICFPAGTPVTTDQGIIAIEKINPDVNTIRGKKIVAITKTVTPQHHLVKITKDALFVNTPSRNTLISMNHCVLYKGKMERARDLVGEVDGVYFKKYNGEILYNVLLEKHSKMIVNNMIVETLDPANIVAKLYSGNYTPEEFNKLSFEISTAVAKDDKKQYEKIYKSLK